MESDDEQVGRVLTRREAVALLGIAGASLLTGCSPGQSSAASPSTASPNTASNASIPGCVVRPAQTEGPYFVDEKLNRSDIRSDPSDGSVKPGTPLEITFAVSQLGAGSCTPIAGAVVDVWHCDASGVYSDVQDPGFSTRGKKFLRGYQLTDASGRATFKTIYPGWYRGRAVHIHFTVRTNPNASSAHEFTSQVYFDDAMNDKVFSQAPYSGKGQIRNAQDGIFRDGGSQLILAVRPAARGYAGTFDIALQTT
ncbi:MAG TPA: intradiol ring-cleavage dioxygenase [Gemmatimonadaceae bacterium]|nr:intradiol ring-cleavage dioxygenase [Gemmatimonadaceae bacterium]